MGGEVRLRDSSLEQQSYTGGGGWNKSDEVKKVLRLLAVLSGTGADE